jgi:hypothetical protein
VQLLFIKKAGVLKLKERRDLQLLMMTHRIVHAKSPDYLSDLVCVCVCVNIVM